MLKKRHFHRKNVITEPPIFPFSTYGSSYEIDRKKYIFYLYQIIIAYLN